MRWGLGVLLVALLLQAARLALHKAFSIDEFQYAHAAWLMAHGQVPYRDFFEVHFPLVYQLLSPLFVLLGDDPRNVLALRAAMLVPLAGACASVFLLNRREGRTAALLAPVLLLLSPTFLHFATEVRPDALTAALFLGALAALAAQPGAAATSLPGAHVAQAAQSGSTSTSLLGAHVAPAAQPGSTSTSLPGAHVALAAQPGSTSTSTSLSGALASLAMQPGSHSSSFLAGLLLAASGWGSQKALFFGGLVGAVLLVDLFLRRGRTPALIASPGAFFLGLATTLTGVATYLTVTGSWRAWWQWCFVWASEHQRHYPGFSWREYLLPALGKEPAFFLLAIVGVGFTVRRMLQHDPNLPLRERLRTPDLLLIVAVPATFGAYALQRAPFPYSLLPFLGVLAVFAARGVLVVLSRLHTPVGRTVGFIGLLGLFAVQAAHVDALLNGGGNARQREVLARIATLTGPEDVVYDNSGGFVSRPHVHFYFYTDAYLRGSLVDLLSHDMPRALVDQGCVLRVDDLRTSGLPPALRRFLDTHYQPFDGDLFLWGQRYRVSTETGRLEDAFLAVRGDRYFVHPASALDAGALFIDGVRITTPEFDLTRGPHAVRYEGRAEGFQLLWLPRDAKRWTPRPGAPATYSRLL
ncbi:hypothetical protein OV207_19455 [Corallococcus sp. BB11-1]|uniref:hypothetical protein n=1 Tax=Corallococcus sp. BB11-1 TaxID=2996783 RepID=UPI00226F2D71|nr:hypothetical protein [Corallococcus sp. BB11-1]MCY1033638.1 hypothetical protein [Corallococcus sp. BB11-1]